MREFLVTYVELIHTNQDMVGQVHQDFKRQFLDMTVDKLLEQFVLNKYTGLEKPGIYYKEWELIMRGYLCLAFLHDVLTISCN